MLNQCEFIGFLGADPEVITFDNGDKVANFSVACTEKWKNKDGEKQEKTEWINIAAFKGLATLAENYLKKGSKVYVSGKMQTRSYDKDGDKRYVTEIVLNNFSAKIVMLDSINSQSASHQEPIAPENTTDDLPF